PATPPATEAPPATPAAATEAKPPVPVPAVAAAPASAKTGIDWIDTWEDFIDQTKAPFPWITWGGDVRFRNEYVGNQTLNENAANRGTRGKYLDYQRTRLRWWTTVTPVKDVDLNLRFESEPRHFSDPNGTPTWNREQAWIDTANVKLTNFLGSPLTMTLGRQDILLGDGWLVGDGTPIDGSRTYYFDAARFSYEFKEVKTTADLIYVQQDHRGNAMLPPLLSYKANVTEQDERGLILWVTNRSIKNTEINGYYIYKDEDRIRNVANSDTGYFNPIGGRVKGDLDDHWQYRLEGATQFGEKNDRHLRAFGANSQLAYFFKDKFKNQLRLFYEYESGDDANSRGTDEGFDPLWGRWPRWTELYTIFLVPGTGEGVTGEFTNLHRFGPGWTFSPCDRLDCALDYNFLFAATDSMAHAGPRGTRPAAFAEGSFRGQLVTFWVTATLTRHLKARLINEVFLPGNFYSDTRQQTACFVRGELYFTW
ncbi:MAG: alginate export family protein, partial [Planctomycetota bacterium]|nr:alginate export family protein [Planctomycetota bacterium]